MILNLEPPLSVSTQTQTSGSHWQFNLKFNLKLWRRRSLQLNFKLNLPVNSSCQWYY